VVHAKKDHLGTTFPPAVRLQRPSDFRHALAGRPISRGALFVVHSPKKTNPEQHTARLGVIVGKRFAPKSVTRSTIKRMIRECFRLRRAQLPPIDLVFRLYRPVPELSLTQLKKRLNKELHWHLYRVAEHHAKDNADQPD